MPQGTANPPSELEQAIAAVLSERLDALGMPAAELSRMSGVSRSHLSRLLSGKKPMRLGEFHAISEALGWNVSEVSALAEVRVVKKRAEAEAES